MSTYLWQNFLTDYKIKKYIFGKISDFIKKQNPQYLVEIWPWKGALTKEILKLNTNIILIEKDTNLIPILDKLIIQNNYKSIWKKSKSIIYQKNNLQLILINDDILNINFNFENYILFWNLPYYITSPILKKFFFEEIQQPLRWFFMTQLEVAQKLDFNSNKKSYLRRLLNYNYKVQLEKIVGAKCFSPPPKVKSALISLNKNKNKIKPNKTEIENILNLFSQFSRKTINKITKILIKKNKIPNQDYNLWNIWTKRLEELSWEEFYKLAKIFNLKQNLEK